MVPRRDLEGPCCAEKRSGHPQLGRRSEPGFHLFRCDSPGNVRVAARLKCFVCCSVSFVIRSSPANQTHASIAIDEPATAVQHFQILSTLGRGRLPECHEVMHPSLCDFLELRISVRCLQDLQGEISLCQLSSPVAIFSIKPFLTCTVGTAKAKKKSSHIAETKPSSRNWQHGFRCFP